MTDTTPLAALAAKLAALGIPYNLDRLNGDRAYYEAMQDAARARPPATTGTPKLNLALSKAQGAMEAAKRDAKNPAFMREGKPSTYATLAAVIDAIRDPFAANELAHFQATLCDDATVSVTTFLLHSSGEERASTFKVPVGKRDPQGFASATTYARRVGLMAAAGIAPDDDDDGNSHSTDAKVRETRTEPRAPSLAQIEKISKALATYGVTVEAIEKRIGHALALMTTADYEACRQWGAELKAAAPTTDPDELARRAVKQQAEEAFKSAEKSLASPATKPTTVEANATFKALAERINAAPSEAEALLIQAEAVNKVSKGDMAALARAVKDRAFILKTLAEKPTQTAGDVPF